MSFTTQTCFTKPTFKCERRSIEDERIEFNLEKDYSKFILSKLKQIPKYWFNFIQSGMVWVLYAFLTFFGDGIPIGKVILFLCVLLQTLEYKIIVYAF